MSRLEIQKDPYPLFKGSKVLSETPNHMLLGLAFPPVGLEPVAGLEQSLLDFSLQEMKALKVQNLRFAESWQNREPRPNVFNWKPLEQRLSAFDAQGINVFLTIQTSAPSWQCGQSNKEYCVFSDLNAFSTYLRTLLQRNGSRLSQIQLGNEVLSPDFYPGSIQEFVLAWQRFSSVVREEQPELQLVLPGFSTGVLRRFAFCEDRADLRLYTSSRYYDPDQRSEFCTQDWVLEENRKVLYLLNEADFDAVDIHLYDDPEYWPIYYQSIKKRVSEKAILVSEFGGPNEAYESYSESYQAERLQKYLETLNILPDLESAYFFKLVPSAGSSLVHRNSTLYLDSLPPRKKKSYEVFQDFAAGLNL